MLYLNCFTNALLLEFIRTFFSRVTPVPMPVSKKLFQQKILATVPVPPTCRWFVEYFKLICLAREAV